MLLSGAVLAASVCFGADAAPGKVTAVRFWSLGEVTRVAIEVSSDFQYTSDRLTDPDRLFFDIQGARPAMVNQGTYVVAVGDALLKQIRLAETNPGTTRVVLDLQQYAGFTASQLSSPDRLMIELRLKDHPSPPATTSMTGSKTLTDRPSHTLEPDLLLLGNSRTTKADGDFLPVMTRPPASVQLPANKVDAKPEAPAQPVLALSASRSIPPPGSTLTGRATAPAAGPLPAKRNADGDRSLTRVLGLKLARVVLDPGHGGNDVGTHGPSGVYEKDVVLDIAQRLGKLLEERLGTEVIYTRSDDTFVPLEERTAIANDRKADLFLSIHANSSPYRLVGGVETFYLNFTTSRAALDLAARENASSERSIFELKELLQKIALKDKIDESREFAARLQTSLYSLSAKGNTAAAKDRGIKKAPFVVLIGASMPSVLAEIGFLTNSADETLLRKPEHRQRIAEALYKGIASYADTLSHFRVAKRN